MTFSEQKNAWLMALEQQFSKSGIEVEGGSGKRQGQRANVGQVLSWTKQHEEFGFIALT